VRLIDPYRERLKTSPIQFKQIFISVDSDKCLL